MKEQSGGFFKALKVLGSVIPGDRLKTAVYLSLVATPRRFLRKSINGFYRMDHIYEVLKEARSLYEGKFSILEFGVADGYSFTKKLFATRYLKLEDRVMVHGFDTFEGLPEETGAADQALVPGEEWIKGQFRGRYAALSEHCRRKYRNFELHRGLFEDTITEDFLASLHEHLPILIWIDCDYYSSTKTVLERLLPFIPSGCVFYFDDIYQNYSSRFTGEMRAVHEMNQGLFGDGLELVPDPALTWDSNRVYRFLNVNAKLQYQLRPDVLPTADPVRRRRNDSPLP